MEANNDKSTRDFDRWLANINQFLTFCIDRDALSVKSRKFYEALYAEGMAPLEVAGIVIEQVRK